MFASVFEIVKPVTVIGLAGPTFLLLNVPEAVPFNVTTSPDIGLIVAVPPKVAVVFAL